MHVFKFRKKILKPLSTGQTASKRQQFNVTPIHRCVEHISSTLKNSTAKPCEHLTPSKTISLNWPTNIYLKGLYYTVQNDTRKNTILALSFFDILSYQRLTITLMEFNDWIECSVIRNTWLHSAQLILWLFKTFHQY